MIRRLSSALRAGLSRLDLREQRLQRIRRKMRAVRRCRRESAQRVGDFRGCDCRRVLERGAAKPLREPRSTSNRRGAAAAQKTCFPDSRPRLSQWRRTTHPRYADGENDQEPLLSKCPRQTCREGRRSLYAEPRIVRNGVLLRPFLLVFLRLCTCVSALVLISHLPSCGASISSRLTRSQRSSDRPFPSDESSPLWRTARTHPTPKAGNPRESSARSP